MSAYTPGPYERHPGSRFTIRAPSGIVGHAQADDDGEAEANFLLFCAAPDLVDAVQGLLSSLAHLPPPPPEIAEAVVAFVGLARAALAKAGVKP